MPFRRPAPAIGLLLAAAALAAGACGSATPSPTSAPTPAGQRTPGPDAAPALAAMLPASAGGVDFVRSSFTGASISDAGVSLDTAKLEALAKAQGKALADVQVAEARPVDASRGGIVLAIRVPGASPEDLVPATFNDVKALKGETLGGKTVYRVAASGLNVAVYYRDDVLFQVIGAPVDLTNAILAALP